MTGSDTIAQQAERLKQELGDQPLPHTAASLAREKQYTSYDL